MVTLQVLFSLSCGRHMIFGITGVMEMAAVVVDTGSGMSSAGFADDGASAVFPRVGMRIRCCRQGLRGCGTALWARIALSLSLVLCF